ncbi:DUF2482 family protein [Mammaliicoccus sciuri]|uniref:DUF2482 family protein n=1 Tax=Mammaliicoccus sciuri TaxID=1296 RepID=UPI0021D3C54C|nr:DUF2482 family protein [Mammaliicoccus sciuri]UXV14901.1 DUF2482 family protein [Mammaliicoccus sciuri]UXV25942.1 DUF2482 family protein [Mammaliicoccus sciuri]
MTKKALDQMTFEELTEEISKKASELHGLLEEIENDTEFTAYGLINVAVENDEQQVGIHTGLLGSALDVGLMLKNSTGLEDVLTLVNMIKSTEDFVEKGANL